MWMSMATRALALHCTCMTGFFQAVCCVWFSNRIARKAAISKEREREGEKTSGWTRQLIDLTVPIDLNSGQDLTLPPDWRNLIMYSDWLMLTDRCVVIGCLLIVSRDTYRSMIVRFASPATRGFLSLLLFLTSLCGKRKPLGPGYSSLYSIPTDTINDTYYTHTFSCVRMPGDHVGRGNELWKVQGSV